MMRFRVLNVSKKYSASEIRGFFSSYPSEHLAFSPNSTSEVILPQPGCCWADTASINRKVDKRSASAERALSIFFLFISAVVRRRVFFQPSSTIANGGIILMLFPLFSCRDYLQRVGIP